MARKYDNKEVQNLFFKDGKKPSTEYTAENKFAPINVDSEGNKVRVVSLSKIEIANEAEAVEDFMDESPAPTSRHVKMDYASSLYGDILNPEEQYLADLDEEEARAKEREEQERDR